MSIQREQQSASHGENVLGCLLRNGEYLVQSLLGRGGMGTIYLAFHTTLSIPLALKQLPADKPLPENVILELDALLHGDDTTRHALLARERDVAFPQSGGELTDRFLREALLLARLQHPSIPTLYDYFFEHGSWYLVLDYLPGPTLGAYLHAHAPLPALVALSYAMQVCEVLVYLQERVPPIVFRDLKPANVILLSDGSLMLSDFGSACYAGTEQASESLDIGSPGYAAPEQYEHAAQVDMRSDFYSLGMMLYEMLTGNMASETAGEPFLSSASPANGLKPLLRGLLRLATQLDPARRFQSARAFYQGLERAYRIEERRVYQEDMPIFAPPPVQMSQQSGEEVLPIVPPRSLDLAHRQQTRVALYNARYERLLHEQLEMQLSSVDEGLQRRSSMPRSSESPIVTERPGRVVLPVHRLQ
ncbi:MAG TPA: serine/threonine-protein kinase, partial [Ktedonobacteraceae bacterium]|nr:serine/threonine-protein kinase [Ktedonobacteraceae bacterium]